MPVCSLCEAESFDLIDGLYYCQSCGTQSQDIRDEMVDEEVVVDGHLQVKQGRGKCGRKRQFFADKGKPWFLYEAFQHIIKLQVEYLIKLGVDPALKDVVFKLWYKYLQQTGNAFTGSTTGTVPTKGSIFYSRHADLLDVNKRKKRGVKKKVDPFADDKLELCSHFSDEEFYEDDDPTRNDDPARIPPKDSNNADVNLGDDWTAFCGRNNTKQVEDVPASEDSSEDEFVGSITLKHDRSFQNGQMTLKSTLAFCYLGLLWINEPVFISDVVRWVKQGQFPYFQASRYLPHHMKFGADDYRHLCPIGVPPVSIILKQASQIARVVQLPSIAKPEMSTYTARFITDLHLPGFLHGVVHKLVTEKVKLKTKIHPAGDRRDIPNVEAGAMAFIVVALKLCYGLDDRTEKEQEAHAISTESSSNSKSRDTIPLFTDWLKSWKHCEAKKFQNGVPWTDEQFKLVRDPTAYAAFCKSDIFGSWEPTDRVYTGQPSKHWRAKRITNEESQERYAQLFKSLMTRETLEEFEGSVTPQVTSFPATCAHVADDTGDGTVSCFDRTSSRGIDTERLLGDHCLPDNDLKYISYIYSSSCPDQDSFHSSYAALLNILADRIEIKPMELQKKVNQLENSLFFSAGRPLVML